MVRAGVVNHPSEYEFCGYNEIQRPRQRYALIDYEELAWVLGFKSMSSLSSKYKGWIEEAIKTNDTNREEKWLESVAVGSESFIRQTKDYLGYKATGRKVHEQNGTFELREPISSYNAILDPENEWLKPKNGFIWNVIDEKTA